MTLFSDLGLNQQIIQSLNELGYEQPSPVQAQSIPYLLEGRDLLAQAQTGTGKTAAFALPILQNLDLNERDPQALVLAPTRELAIQVAESMQSYAKHMNGFRVLPIYGGREYDSQLRALKRGVHVVVGTPGRIMDHLRRKTLRTGSLTTLVLDEADEMLRMGFIDDVNWILQQIKQPHQNALFSATMPDSIRRVAKKFLKNPAKVHIEPKMSAVTSIEQHYMIVAKKNKLDSLTRYFDMEETDAVLIFTGTKTFSVEVADKLCARGYRAAALNGDMNQRVRENVIAKLKNGDLDMVVATEVAARGLDVERIGHVVNLDIPQSAESYIHRIGRTGRAGREGKALLFVTPKEQYMLRDIEKMLGHPLDRLTPPSVSEVKRKRADKFKAEIAKLLADKDLDDCRELVEEFILQQECSALDVAAALTHMVHKANEVSDKEMTDAQFEGKVGRKSAGKRKPHRGRGRSTNNARRSFDRRKRKKSNAEGKPKSRSDEKSDRKKPKKAKKSKKPKRRDGAPGKPAKSKARKKAKRR